MEIKGKEYPLSEIFSKKFEYHIPSYQRPYAWTTEQAGELFDDLYDEFKKEKKSNYFLGSIVLIKDKDSPEADVVDGQQRLTTLTILFAVIADCLNDDKKEKFKKYIIEDGEIFEGIGNKPRLFLRKQDQDFFNKYIQNVNLDELAQVAPSKLNEAQKHIKENCELLKDKIREDLKNEEEIFQFATFLIQHCYLVAVSTDDEASAFKVFSVMNCRGLDLTNADRIKPEVIGAISLDEQQYYTEKWDTLEAAVTREKFDDIFAFIRMIYAKTKPKMNILDEFRDAVLKKYEDKTVFMDKVLEPYAQAYMILTQKNYKSERDAEKINNYLWWLNKIDDSDWIPTAMEFMCRYENNSEYVLWFFRKLECLAAYLYITAKSVNKRIERYRPILEEMEANQNEQIKSVELSEDEKKEFKDVLNGEIYNKLTSKRRNYLILRLNSFVSDTENQWIDTNILTIEHVLPQTLLQNSKWEKDWQDEEQRAYWLNRIANLVPLTRYKNSEAQNYDFDDKKIKYFTGKNGTSSFPLTTQVLNEPEWTPETVEKRQENLVQVLSKKWELE